MANDTNEALKISKALEPLIEKIIREKTGSCIRSKKYVVVTEPADGVVGVTEGYGDEIFLPYNLALESKLLAGTGCRVQWYQNDMSTARVVAMGTGNAVAAVEGVKGSEEATYRYGNVNITAANVGALTTANIIDSLTSTSTVDALAANQGRVLDEKIDALTLSDIGTSTSGVNAQTLMDTKQERLDLLWENPSPTASFAAQTLSLDLSDYDYVDIFMQTSTSSPTRILPAGRFIKGNTGVLRCGGAAGDLVIYSRNIISISDGGIEFGDGYGNSGPTNVDAIPRMIYGGKW